MRTLKGSIEKGARSRCCATLETLHPHDGWSTNKPVSDPCQVPRGCDLHSLILSISNLRTGYAVMLSIAQLAQRASLLVLQSPGVQLRLQLGLQWGCGLCNLVHSRIWRSREGELSGPGAGAMVGCNHEGCPNASTE